MFPSTWRTLSPNALFTRIWACLTYVLFLLVIRELSPPKCFFVMANARLPNRPGFDLPQ